MGHYIPQKNPSSFRKLAAAMWKAPNDPTIVGGIDVDMTASLAFLERYNKTAENKVTVTHLVARAVAMLLARHPEFNAKVECLKQELQEAYQRWEVLEARRHGS